MTAAAALDAALIAAHEEGDRVALVRLYTQAAEAESDLDAACFFITQAYVFALESGAAEARGLHERLCALGREE